MARLKLRYDPNCETIEVIEQEGRNDGFNRGDYMFTASNGFELRSDSVPQAVEDGLYVRGSNRHEDNRLVTPISRKWLDKLRVAVREYNTAKPMEIIE